ncbi:Gfo/Idh/MocA family oxidoreductase [Flavobacterium selenitireducens]|uniref:Gfo/Idh/MocA family oxidoreductase n=1 Tax=Flavobacterium selenitireducens TaxID=2722704 RepID=UPI00168BE551|nr:Gfo/Idh/MocA family oxidoreductase [Flavobacterium selenitireducens]MBD3581752.1 Gfo/Idh/MocA family oxidoreductase [Flavobacterium selenitireducens]
MQQISTALLSYGMSGKIFHAPFLELHPGFELVGCWERSRKLIQEDYPMVKSYASLEEVLSDESVELVIVNTPTETHFEYAKAALEAGKHVLVEKAFTATVAEAEELKEIATEKNRKIAVFQNRRYDSDFKTVKDIFDKEILGETVEAEFHFDRYNPNLSPKPHKEVRSGGSGILKDLGSHIIDQALFLFGFPEGLFADVRSTRENSVVDDWFDITLFYPKFRVRLKASYFVRESLPAYVIHGKKGSFIKSRGDVQEDELKTGKKPMVTDWGKEPDFKKGVLNTEIEGEEVREHVPTIPGNYYHFFDDLYHAVKKNKPLPVSAEDGIKTMRIIEAAIESASDKKYIHF